MLKSTWIFEFAHDLRITDYPETVNLSEKIQREYDKIYEDMIRDVFKAVLADMIKANPPADEEDEFIALVNLSDK